MKRCFILILLILPSVIFCQSKYYFASFGKSTFTQQNIDFDSYDMINSFKVGFGRNYLKDKLGFSYNFYFSSIGAYHNMVDTVARLPYIGVNPSFIYKLNKFSVNTGLYFSYCLYRKSPSIYPEAFHYYKKTDFGFTIQPEFKIAHIKHHHIVLTSELFGSILPIYTTNVGSRPAGIHKSTRNLGFSVGLKFILGK